ncbi:MAG: hypothetical protein ACO27J_00840 [Ilumatobacteraceae bacterium]
MFRSHVHQHTPDSERAHTDPGQATTEYALVLIGAAVIALLVVAWATDGGGAGRIGELFENVLSNVLSRAETIDE